MSYKEKYNKGKSNRKRWKWKKYKHAKYVV